MIIVTEPVGVAGTRQMRAIHMTDNFDIPFQDISSPAYIPNDPDISYSLDEDYVGSSGEPYRPFRTDERTRPIGS